MAAGRRYQKGNPEIEPLECVETKSSVSTFYNRGFVSVPNSRYTKPEATKVPQALFVIYSGGTEREKDYSCFEVWLYYAEKSDRPVDFVIPQNKLEISSFFKTWANTHIKGGLKPTKAIFNIEQNITNAKKNYVEETGFPTLFSTQMFRLAEL